MWEWEGGRGKLSEEIYTEYQGGRLKTIGQSNTTEHVFTALHAQRSNFQARIRRYIAVARKILTGSTGLANHKHQHCTNLQKLELDVHCNAQTWQANVERKELSLARKNQGMCSKEKENVWCDKLIQKDGIKRLLI